jgi:hypothetical protein
LTVNINYTWARLLNQTKMLSEGGAGAPACVRNGCPVDNVADTGSPILVNGWKQYDYGNGDLDIHHRISAMINYELPFGKSLHGIRAAVLKGWAANLAGVWETGTPFTVTNGGRSRTGVTNAPGNTDRPNQISSFSRSNPSVSQWFNASAFKEQTVDTFGNERRNQLFGPHQRHADLSLSKDFPLYESMKLQFRAEAFNLTNTANFNQPISSITAYNSDGSPSTTSGSFGAVTSTSAGSSPRQVQFALKLTY